ncbi:MAG: DUF1559 domain-containing protein, partial [Thermoguttaceae bacterium]|nr:DUF1559 domain-containing protein [Thermoguttaceae bacterium]
CINNKKNIALAMHNMQDNKKTIPFFRTSHTKKVRSGTVVAPNFDSGLVNWLFQLFPYMEANNVVDAYDNTANTGGTLAKFQLPFAHCPSRGKQEEDQLSYVGNCGKMDGLIDITTGKCGDQTKNYGVMTDDGTNNHVEATKWPKNGGKEMSIDDIIDGTSNTIYISENLQAGSIWSTEEFQVGFVYPSLTRTEYAATTAGISNSDPGSDCGAYAETLDALTFVDNGSLIDATGTKTRVTTNDTTYAGVAPMKIGHCANELQGKAYAWLTARPSSYHAGSFVVALCDGSCRTVSYTVEPKAFRQAMCPNDKKIGIATNYSVSDL